MIALYTNIKNERIAKGLSQEELAHKVGYADKTMISRIENGKIDLSQSKIKEFAAALGVTPGYLMGWDVPKDNEPQSESEDVQIAKAMELYEKYQNAIPEIQEAVENLLKASKRDS